MLVNIFSKLRSITLGQGFKHTLLYSFGLFSNKAISFLMLPFITHLLAPSEYSQLEILTTITYFGVPIFGAGLQAALFRYAGSAKNVQVSKEYCACAVTASLSWSFLLGIISLLLLPTIKQNLPGNPTYTQLIAIIIALGVGSIQSIQLGWLRIQKRAILFTVFCYGRAIIQALMTLYFLYQGYGVTGVIISMTLSGLIATSGLFLIQMFDTGFGYSREHIRQLYKFGTPLIFGNIASFAFFGLDLWWLAKYIDLNDLAEYALARKLAIVASFLLEPFNMWWQPRRFSTINEQNGDKFNVTVSTVGIVLYFSAALITSVGGAIAIYLMTPPSYHSAIILLPILSTLIAAKGVSELMGFGCHLKQTGNTLMLIDIVCAALSIACYSTLIPLSGTYGVIFTLGVVYLTRWALLWHYSQNQIYLNYPFQHIVVLFLLPTVSALFGLFTGSIQISVLFPLFTLAIFTLYTIKFKLIPSIKTFIDIS